MLLARLNEKARFCLFVGLFKGKLFYEKCVHSQALTLPDPGLLVCPQATNDQQIYDLK